MLTATVCKAPDSAGCHLARRSE